MTDGFNVEVDNTRALALFDGLPREMVDALQRKCGMLGLLLEAKVKGKLSGEVLNVVSGRLRRSIHSDVKVDGLKVTSSVASSGDVPYARLHEFGYLGPEHVRAHVREITSVFGHALKDPILVQVKPFDRIMDMPERSFMRSSLGEMSDEIVRELQSIANGVAK